MAILGIYVRFQSGTLSSIIMEVESDCVSKGSTIILLEGLIFYFHDYGTKGSWLLNVGWLSLF